MSTRKLWSFGQSRVRQARRQANRAFTLIEVLVVVAIIALLVAILLPSLTAARDYAKEVVCGSHLHGMGTGLHNYLYVSKDWLPGVNTSGVTTSSLQTNKDELQQPYVPVQPHDWMTPIITDMQLPSKRAERFKFLLDYYKCPALLDTPSVLYPSGAYANSEEKAEFEAVSHWPPTSYLMPVYFQLWGQKHRSATVGYMAGSRPYAIKAEVAPTDWDGSVEGYKSRLNEVGTPAGKVFVAEGTRYLDDSGILDFDPSPFPNFFGAFSSQGAWRAAGTAYGVRVDGLNGVKSLNWSGRAVGEGSASQGKNLFLSYRHRVHSSNDGTAKTNKGLINMLFYDGHVELVGDQDSRKIDYWYPKGAVIQNHLAGMTDVEQNRVIN